MLEALDRYYSAEVTGVFWTMILSFAVWVGGFLLLRFGKRDFLRGLAWPMIVAGIAVLVGSATYAFRLADTREFYQRQYEIEPSRFREMELGHLKQVDENFQKMLFVTLALSFFGVGIGIKGLRKGRAFTQGLGAGIFALALLVTMLELNNRARAQEYAAVLEADRPAATTLTPAEPQD